MDVKEGDKIIITKVASNFFFRKGQIGTVVDINYDHPCPYVIEFKKGICWRVKEKEFIKLTKTAKILYGIRH